MAIKEGQVLIVGGAGYIGSVVNKALNDQQFSTVVLDNLSTGDRRAVHAGEFVEGDMGDAAVLDRVFSSRRITAVMHFAACKHVGESVVDPIRYYQNNVANTLTLLHAMLRHRVNVFIFSSTAAIFGMPEEPRIREQHPLRPINPYGRSKLMVEEILKDFEAAYGLKFCSLRYFNAAGGDPEGKIKWYNGKESNLIPVVLRSLKYGERKATIFGSDYPTKDGTCIRDFVHISDLGSAHIAALQRLLNGGASACYNLGSGQGFSVKEVIEAAAAVTGIQPLVSISPKRAGDPPVLVADSSQAKKELKWQPRFKDLSIIIEHAWQALPEGENK